MQNYPEFKWIYTSLEKILDEIRKNRELTNKLRNNQETQRYFYDFPYHMIRNPMRTFYIEFELEQEIETLRSKLSEN